MTRNARHARCCDWSSSQRVLGSLTCAVYAGPPPDGAAGRSRARRAVQHECRACRSPATTSSATASGPSSSTAGRSAPTRVILDLGVQDTGPDGAGLALDLRGARSRRGRPGAAPGRCAGRRTSTGAAEAAAVAAAVAPWSEADAAKRIFDAAKPLREAGHPGPRRPRRDRRRDARDRALRPTVKGDISRRARARASTRRTSATAGSCDATHTYEQPFRLSAAARRPRARAGHLAAGAAPDPRLARAGRHGSRSTSTRSGRCCTCLGPATPKQVAGYVDAPVHEVAARSGPRTSRRSRSTASRGRVLAGDVAALTGAAGGDGGAAAGSVRPVPPGPGPRDSCVPDEAARKDLWRTLGRPGGLLRRPRRGRHLATALVGRRSCGSRWRSWSGARPTGRARRGTPSAWPPSGARRSPATCRG